MSNMVVRTNILALNSHRNLGMVGKQQANASGRLSSGFRINSAADDAAGLGISEKMRSQIRGLDQASRNGQDGISLIQTAEGAMSTINEMVVRIRELVIQASNDTNAHEDENLAQSDRSRIQDEINQLMDEIDATRNRTQFNTRNLIDGSLAGEVAGGVDQYELNRAAREYMKNQFVVDQIEQAGENAISRGQNTVLDDLSDAYLSAQSSSNAAQTALDSAKNDLAGAKNDLNTYSADYFAALAALSAAQEAFNAVANGASPAAAVAGATALLQKILEEINAGISGLYAANTASNITSFNDIDEMIDALDGGAGNTALRDLYDIIIAGAAATSAASITELQNAYSAFIGALVTTMEENFNTGNFLDSGEDFSNVSQDIKDAFMMAVKNSIDGSIGQNAQDLMDSIVDPASLDAARLALSQAEMAYASAEQPYENALSSYSAFSQAVKDAEKELALINTTLNNSKKAYEKLRDSIKEEAKTTERTRIKDQFLLDNASSYMIEAASGNELWFQIGANKDQGVRLGIEDVGTKALSLIGMNGQKGEEIGDYTFDRLRTKPSGNPVHGNGYEDGPAYDPEGGVINASGEEIQKFVIAIDEALAHVTGQRSNLGAMQNRLEYTIENLNIASENLSAAESRIRDADMAKEMMRLTQANVLQQAATAMLAQANQAPQSVLQLLG